MENLILWNLRGKNFDMVWTCSTYGRRKITQICDELGSDGEKEESQTKEKLVCWSNEGYGTVNWSLASGSTDIAGVWKPEDVINQSIYVCIYNGSHI